MQFGHLMNQLYQDKLMKIKIIFLLIFIANIGQGQVVNLFKIANNVVNSTPIATTNVARFYQNLTESYDSTHYNSFATSYSA